MAKKIAVVGAGAAGIATLRKFTSEPEDYEVIGFERAGEVGGVWVYTEKNGTDVDGLPVHASMYKNVRMNLPKDFLKFFDYPHKNPLPCFGGYEDLRDYLQEYTAHFKLGQYIKFNTIVTRVKPLSPGDRDTRWEVTFCDKMDQQKSASLEFDYVVICNGHNAVPVEPSFPGLDQFRGEIIHSHDYRVPETFKDKTVVCVGGGPSAMDMAADLDGTAKKVILSRDVKRCLLDFKMPAGVSEKPNIERVTENSVVFTNGERETVDIILVCSGYKYSYPFCKDDCGIVLQDQDQRVTPLYKLVVNTEYPTMLFVGVEDFCNHFNVFDVQASFLLSIVSGRVALPTKEEMLKDEQQDLESFLKTGLPSRHIHKLADRQFDYMDSLLEMMGKPKIPKGYRVLFDEVIRLYVAESLTFREKNYELTEESYILLPEN